MEKHTPLTVAQVAVELGLHRVTVRRLLRDGVLVGRKLVGQQWRICRGDLEGFVTSGVLRRQGRPRGSMDHNPSGEETDAGQSRCRVEGVGDGGG